jgi:type 2 lantibiotic biosynthesis protein LanM
MELKQLAWFFEDEVAAARREFLARRLRSDAEAWLEASTNDLLRALFAATHKVLVAQFKLIEADVGFDEFCHSLRQPDIRAYLYRRYPLLRDRMAIVCARWLEQTSLLLRRFEQDFETIRAELLPGDAPLDIERVRFGQGDYHRGGRSVAILEFRDGRRLVYKPRDMAIDARLARIFAWVNERCATDLWLPALVARSDYGWVGFVSHRPCSSPGQVERFYQRMGSLLGLLYMLGGNDFHYENIIADGEHPVLIDLESLFRPLVGGRDDGRAHESVLMIGMLPNRMSSAGHIPEISGLSDAEGQPGLEALHLMHAENDSIALVRARGLIAGASNVPVLDGRKIELGVEHAAQLQAGFERVYRAVMEDQESFTALADACAEAQVRVLFRHTAAYGNLLEEATHPSLLASAEGTAKHFALLRLGIGEFKPAERFVDLEIADLHRGDVPLFTTRAGSLDLWYADDAWLPDFFACSGLEAVRRRIAQLSPQDLERQLWIIGNAFISHGARTSVRGRARARLEVETSPGQPLDQRLIAHADALAAQLLPQMHVTDDTASWLVHLNASLDNSHFQLLEASYDLNSGMAGEILFFAQLAQATGDFSHARLAHKALRHLNRQFDRPGASNRPLGYYVGVGSVIHLLIAMARLEGEYSHLQQAEALLADGSFESAIEQDRSLGLIKGAAGFMLACSELHLASGSRRALQLARACAEHLLARREPDVEGFAWRISSAIPLAGMAHGASGFALAFARLFEAGGEARYREAALQALRYEDTLFHPASENWLDRRDFVLREHGDRPWCSVGWAHGAPGIGLARLAMLRAGIDTPRIRQDLDIALRTTLAQGFNGGDSLIFGSFGNLELPISYAECFGQESVPQLAPLAASLLARIEREELRLSAPAAFPLGLMAGTTGVAYQCLRLARMHQVPSVLCGTSTLSSVSRLADAGGAARGAERARAVVAEATEG